METAGSVVGTRSAWTPASARGRARAPSLVRCRAAAVAMQQPPPSVRTIAIPFADLKERGRDLSGKIEEGLGPNGLGIISISDVPDFPALRRTLLRLAPRVANLPEDVKEQLEDPDSRYNFGWSHGKEKLESGKLDTFKGSYYANPILDVPTTDDALLSRYPSYCRPNIWPADHLRELEIAFKALGKLMLEVGMMLAHHCDLYGMYCINITVTKAHFFWAFGAASRLGAAEAQKKCVASRSFWPPQKPGRSAFGETASGQFPELLRFASNRYANARHTHTAAARARRRAAVLLPLEHVRALPRLRLVVPTILAEGIGRGRRQSSPPSSAVPVVAGANSGDYPTPHRHQSTRGLRSASDPPSEGRRRELRRAVAVSHRAPPFRWSPSPIPATIWLLTAAN